MRTSTFRTLHAGFRTIAGQVSLHHAADAETVRTDNSILLTLIHFGKVVTTIQGMKHSLITCNTAPTCVARHGLLRSGGSGDRSAFVVVLNATFVWSSFVFRTVRFLRQKLGRDRGRGDRLLIFRFFGDNGNGGDFGAFFSIQPARDGGLIRHDAMLLFQEAQKVKEREVERKCTLLVRIPLVLSFTTLHGPMGN